MSPHAAVFVLVSTLIRMWVGAAPVALADAVEQALVVDHDGPADDAAVFFEVHAVHHEQYPVFIGVFGVGYRLDAAVLLAEVALEDDGGRLLVVRLGQAELERQVRVPERAVGVQPVLGIADGLVSREETKAGDLEVNARVEQVESPLTHLRVSGVREIPELAEHAERRATGDHGLGYCRVHLFVSVSSEVKDGH